VPDIARIIQSGGANPWFYLPAALRLGALHALEPGHSKSMMAAHSSSRRAERRGRAAWATAIPITDVGMTTVMPTTPEYRTLR